MADSFTIQYSGKVIPIEEVEAADGSKTRMIHTNIDKIFGGLNEVSISGTSTRIKYKDYTTTTSNISLEHGDIFDGDLDIEFMFIKIREAVSTGTPNLRLFYNAGAGPIQLMNLVGINDFLIWPRIDSELDGNGFSLSSSGSTTLSKVDILIGEIE